MIYKVSHTIERGHVDVVLGVVEHIGQIEVDPVVVINSKIFELKVN